MHFVFFMLSSKELRTSGATYVKGMLPSVLVLYFLFDLKRLRRYSLLTTLRTSLSACLLSAEVIDFDCECNSRLTTSVPVSASFIDQTA